MRKKQQPIEEENELYVFATKTLSRRAYTVSEMWKLVTRKCADEDVVKRVMARLREARYLDDARYAKQFARGRSEGRKQGRFRIQRELRARGVADAHIEGAMSETLSGADEAAAVRQRIERKLRTLRGGAAALDQRRMASLYASLLRAGFSAEVVRREVRALTKRTAGLPEESE